MPVAIDGNYLQEVLRLQFRIIPHQPELRMVAVNEVSLQTAAVFLVMVMIFGIFLIQPV
jgi:hypothetical protein